MVSVLQLMSVIISEMLELEKVLIAEMALKVIEARSAVMTVNEVT